MPKVIKENFSQRLAAIRKTKGLTQHELSKLSGLSRRTIAHYETKIKEIPQDKIVLIAKALNVSTDELLGHAPVKEKEAISKKVFKNAKLLNNLQPEDQKAVARFINALTTKK